MKTAMSKELVKSLEMAVEVIKDPANEYYTENFEGDIRIYYSERIYTTHHMKGYVARWDSSRQNSCSRLFIRVDWEKDITFCVPARAPFEEIRKLVAHMFMVGETYGF